MQSQKLMRYIDSCEKTPVLDIAESTTSLILSLFHRISVMLIIIVPSLIVLT